MCQIRFPYSVAFDCCSREKTGSGAELAAAIHSLKRLSPQPRCLKVNVADLAVAVAVASAVTAAVAVAVATVAVAAAVAVAATVARRSGCPSPSSAAS